MADKPSRSVDVEFSGVVQSENRAELLKEFIKYILYQRSQIPMYFDQIKDFLKQQSMLSNEHVSTAIRDQQNVVENVESLFETIEQVFASGETIKQVAIILGSTIVTPKDCYVISFPTEFYEGLVLSRQACISALFRSLYDCDFLSPAKPLHTCTNLHVLFLAPRNCHLQRCKLVPKLSFRIPLIGMRFNINIVYLPDAVTLGNSKLDLVGEELDISGIKPLDDSLCSTGKAPLADLPSADVMSTPRSPGNSANDDFVWFEAPTRVKGYRDKTPDTKANIFATGH
jgi:hypothetical protein